MPRGISNTEGVLEGVAVLMESTESPVWPEWFTVVRFHRWPLRLV